MVHSFRTLLTELRSIVRNVCRCHGAAAEPTFDVFTAHDAKQQCAYDLLETITV